jgi:hypothetical protein
MNTAINNPHFNKALSNVEKLNPYYAKVWNNHPINKNPNPYYIDNNFSDFPPIIIAIGAIAAITAAVINAASAQKQAKNAAALEKQAAADQKKLEEIKAQADELLLENKTKDYTKIILYGVIVLAIVAAILMLLKKKQVL